MYTQLNDLNLNSSIAKDLRDYPVSSSDTLTAIKRLEQLLPQENTLEQARLLAYIGGLLRRVNHLDQAKHYLLQAIEIAQKEQDTLKQSAYEIRLGHVYHWMASYTEAEKLFQQVLQRCQENEQVKQHYLDFIWQHYGKCKFDQGRYSQALEMFNKALTIRKKKANSELIQSSQFALEITQEQLWKSNDITPKN